MKATLHFLATLIGLGLLQVDAIAQEEPPFRGIKINPSSEINCLSNPETIGVIVENWIPGLQYLWNTGETDSIIEVKPTVSTTYQVTISHPDYNSTDVNTFQVDVKNDPILIDDQTIQVKNDLCPGSEVSIEVEATGGHGQLEYDWNFGSNSNQVTVAPTKTTIYTVTVIDECFSKSTAAVTVNVEEQKPIEADDQIIEFVCIDEDLTLKVDLNSVNGGIGYGYAYSLKNDIFNNEPMTVSANEGDTYYAKITDACAFQSKEISITLHKKDPIIPSPEEIQICKGAEIELTESESGQFYLWRDGQLYADFKEVVDESQVINLTYIDECSDQHSVSKTILIDEIEADFESTTHIGSNNISLNCKNSNYETYQWYLNGKEVSSLKSLELELLAGTNNTITLTTSNKNGCTATSTRNIILRDGIDAPTAFTPDGDGLNDEFSVRFEETLVEFEIEIFNRWGQLIYKSNDQYFKWDGFEGNPENQFNSFVYKLRGTTSAGTTFDKNGTITLIRTK